MEENQITKAQKSHWLFAGLFAGIMGTLVTQLLMEVFKLRKDNK